MKRILTCVAAVVGGLAYAETNVFSGETNLTTSAAIAALSQTDLKLSATKASLAPGEAFAVSVGAVTTSDATSLQLNAGGQDGVLTAASLAPQSGHVLVVSPGSAARQLGDAERLVVPGTAEMRRGYPTLVTRPAEPGVAPFKFLTYDAARGYVPVESSGGIWNTGDIWGNTRHLDTPIWLSAKTKINDGNFYVTSTNGVVKGETSIPLTLDSAWRPVGVSFSHPERKEGLAFTVGGGGISVENSPACIWASCAGTTWNTGYNTSWGRIVHFTGPLIGCQYHMPMTFAGWANDTREYCSFNFQSANNCVQWKGPTYVSGVRLVLNNTNAAGLANAVHVLDGPTPTTRAQLMLTGSGTIGQKLCVSGYGPSDAGSVHITGVQPWTLTGGLELAGDAYLTHDNPTCGLDLSCAVTGDGRLVQGNGFVTVRNPSTHTGGTKLMAANSLVSVVTNGTLGNGETQVANGTLRFVDSEKIDQSGRIAAEAGRVEFRSPWFRSFGGLDAVTSVQNGLFEATSAGDIFFGDLEQKGTIHVTSAGDDLIVGAGGAAVRCVSLSLDDGKTGGTVGFCKTGRGTLELYRSGTGSGPVTVREGTLKLSTNLLATADVSYWLDASAGDTVERDGNGRVTAWKDVRGNGVVFSPSAFTKGTAFAPTYRAEAEDGRGGVWFEGIQTNSLAANGQRLASRTVLMVMRPAEQQIQWTCGVFGRLESDYGVRYTSGNYWNRDAAKVSFCSKYPVERINGQDHNYNTVQADTLHLVTLRHDDADEANVSVSGNPTTQAVAFTPALGGYYSPFGEAVPRFYSGEICEVLAFGRILDDKELKSVENYLMRKWGITASHAGDLRHDALLPDTDVTVESGATLDLNGQSLTLGQLSGAGRVENVAGEGTCDLAIDTLNGFSGSIGSGIDITLSGSVEVSVSAAGVLKGLSVAGKVVIAPGTRLVVNIQQDTRLHGGQAILTAVGGISGRFASVEYPAERGRITYTATVCALEPRGGGAIFIR